MSKQKKTKEKSNSLRNYLFMLGFICKHTPFYLFGYLVFDVLANIPWILTNVVLLKYIIDVVTSGVDLYRAAVACVAFAVFIIIGNLLNTVFYEIYLPKEREKLYFKMYSVIYEKAAKMDYEAYDNPAYYNDLVLAMTSMSERAQQVMSNTKDILTNIVSVLTIGTVIVTIDPMCLVFVFLCVAFMVPVGRLIAKVNVQRTEAMTPYDRKNLYFSRVFYLQDYAKELRLSRAGTMIERRYQKNIHDRLATISPYLAKQWKLYFCQESMPLTLLIYLGITLFMGYKAIVTKEISMGDFAATFNGATAISNSVFAITSWFAISFRENGLYVEKFKRFMNAKEKIIGGDNKTVHKKPVTIRFENVSFTYPGTDKAVLKNINLEIKPYQKIALVGYNGAGKTTLTNLLLRLYDVTEGRITVDGVDIREWDIPTYHRNFAAVFQDFSLFGATVGENVAMNDHPDAEKVKKALASGNFQKDLPEDTNTILLREFDESGLSLSGGEAQKVAIARAFYKDCPFAVLDEPSANLDPVAEYTLNQAMTKAAENKTVIFISHRLSTTVMADCIYMLENGEIVETGTHEQLMQQNGKYAYMFNLQADKYKEQN
ncbi:MAG: ABC transporter ATP-binding protein [Ruminococcaceae bacterium]|nr:ABC transporter ATP-binding protein [Oscillospiraceae bacterium]